MVTDCRYNTSNIQYWLLFQVALCDMSSETKIDQQNLAITFRRFCDDNDIYHKHSNKCPQPPNSDPKIVPF